MSGGHPTFQTRGVVLLPSDLTLTDWPERVRRAGLTTIALHDGARHQAILQALQSEAGQAFLERCRALGWQGHITTFAAWIDADYVAAFGDPPLEEYGVRLLRWGSDDVIRES